MPRTYAVPDLHGRADLLNLAIDAITVRGGGTVVFLGDYIDRGPASRETVERLMERPPKGQRWITLKGNHEAMLLGCYRGRTSCSMWTENGGEATLSSYSGIIPEAHLRWFEALPDCFVTRHRLFVHAGIDPMLPLREQTAETMLWRRYPRGLDQGCGTLHIVHGHTPDTTGPESYSRRTNLDTLSWQTGHLALGIFDDALPGGPVEIMWVQGEPYERVTNRSNRYAIRLRRILRR